MNMTRVRIALIVVALLGIGSPALEALAQNTTERRAAINEPVVGILGAGINGQMTQLLWDISRVTTENGKLRVLPILGGGSLQNIEDLLYLRGIDGAMVQSDVLAFYDRLGVEDNLASKLEYVAPLGTQLAHLLAVDSISGVDELEGKRVNFGRETSGTAVSASNIFDDLGIVVDATNLSHRKALKALKSGEIDAMFWMSVPPVDLLQTVKQEDGLHFLEIPQSRIGNDAYQPGELTADFYEAISQGEKVPTVSVNTVLAVYNWPKDHPRYAKVKRFVESLKANFENLRSDPYHPVFRTVNIDDQVAGGWRRFD